MEESLEMVEISRREFLEKSGRTALGVGLGAMVGGAFAQPAAAQRKRLGANDKVLIGCIGMGGMGMGNMGNLMNVPGVEVVAVCDVDSSRLEQAGAEVEKRAGRKPQMIKDFRKLLEIKEIDAVSVGTPDHWHALPMILAAEAGKDVYLEKPISHDIIEANAMVAAARKYGTVVQCGTWQRSGQHFVDANRFLHAGKLGKISVCRAWTCGHAGCGKVKPTAAPKELDWDFWIGPAKWEAYRANAAHGSFRWFFNYAAGLTGDWGAHMIDTVLQGMNDWHPQEVASYGGKLVCGEDDDRTTPDTQIAIFKFPTWVLQWEIHVGDPGLDGGGHHGAQFIGENGVLRVDRGGYYYTPKGEAQPQGPTEGEPVPTDHWRNFIDCVKTRELPRSDIFTMQYSNALCHLANLTYLLGRSVRWDGKKQQVVGDKEATRVQSYYREYRKPWVLPRHDLDKA